MRLWPGQGDQIGCAGTVLTCQDDPRSAGRSSIPVGHMGAGTLVMDTDKLDIPGVIKCIKQFHGGGTDQTEHHLGVFDLQGLDGGLATGQRFHRSVTNY